MKNLIVFILCCGLSFSPGLVFGQQEGITSAFQKSSATALKGFFASSVDLTLPTMEGTFSADRAVSVMNDFFTKYPVKSYKVVHVSTPQQGRANYSIAEMTTANGNFRTTIYFDELKKITEIRVQE